jgi:hypothetical protein
LATVCFAFFSGVFATSDFCPVAGVFFAGAVFATALPDFCFSSARAASAGVLESYLAA